MQKPTATLVTGYRTRQNKFEKHVRKGEHGIRILCPVVSRTKLAESFSREEVESSGKETPGKDWSTSK